MDRHKLCPEKKCQLKYVPMITQLIPNQNQSHIKENFLPDYIAQSNSCLQSQCWPKTESSEIQRFPVNCTESQKFINGCYDVPTGHQKTCECQNCISARAAVIEKDCPQHMEGNRWEDLSKKSSDPITQEIYDRLRSSSGLKSLLQWPTDDETLPCVLRRFRNADLGYLGEAKIHYGAAQDCDLPKSLVHGVVEYDMKSGGELVSPPPKSWFNALENEIAESVYESNRKFPVGKSHDQLANLPTQVHPYTTTFGIESDKDISAGDLINPKKDRHFVEAEHNCCHHLYRKTHSSYDPCERICRKYGGNFKRTNTFGMKTAHGQPNDPVTQIIGSWRKCNPDPPYVNKTYADHYDQWIPKLGQPQDRLCESRHRGPHHAYGMPSEKERERPISEIIFNRCPNEGGEKCRKMLGMLKDWVIKMRKSFKSDHGSELETLYEDFQEHDLNCDGTIEWTPFMNALIKNKVPRTMEPFEFMEALAFIHIFHPEPCNKIDYYRLMDFIKGHDDPLLPCNVMALKPYYNPHTNGTIHFRTTYSDLTANMCREESCISWAKENRVNGMPSVRKDRVPQKIRGTRDTTNYGDDGDAYSLIWPSVYTTRGVTSRDAFKELSKEQICKILCRAGINVSHREVDLAFERAKIMDPEKKERICFQTFRESLAKLQADELDAYGLTYDTEITDCCQNNENGLKMEKIKNPKANPCAGVDP